MYEIKSSAKVFDQHRVFHYTLAGRPLVVETGKLADLVVLDQNPLAVDKNDIRNIKVVKTYKKGEKIYERV